MPVVYLFLQHVQSAKLKSSTNQTIFEFTMPKIFNIELLPSLGGYGRDSGVPLAPSFGPFQRKRSANLLKFGANFETSVANLFLLTL